MKGSQYALVPAKRNGSPSNMNFVPSVYGTPAVHLRFVILSSNGQENAADTPSARAVAAMNFMIPIFLCQRGNKFSWELGTIVHKYTLEV
jgi:hypothetical protein